MTGMQGASLDRRLLPLNIFVIILTNSDQGQDSFMNAIGKILDQ